MFASVRKKREFEHRSNIYRRGIARQTASVSIALIENHSMLAWSKRSRPSVGARSLGDLSPGGVVLCFLHQLLRNLLFKIRETIFFRYAYLGTSELG